MSNFERVGVIFVTGLVAVILAMSFFGTGHDQASTARGSAQGDSRAQGEPASSVQPVEDGLLARRAEAPDTPGEERPPLPRPAGRPAGDDRGIVEEPPPVTTAPAGTASVEAQDVRRRGFDQGLWDEAREREPVGTPSPFDEREPQREEIAAKEPAPPPAADREIPPRRKAPQAGPSSGGKYTIQPGDTLCGISQKLLGSEKHWTLLRDANPGVDPKKLHVGAVLEIPDLEGGTDSDGPAVPKTYRVARGDTLYDIAGHALEDTGRWREILALNKDVIRDARTLKVGQILRLPE